MTREAAIVRLWSRQPAGSRVYPAAAACPSTAPSPGANYLECRQLTGAAFGTTELAPGDRIELIQPLTIQAEGTRLSGLLSATNKTNLQGLAGSGTTVTTAVGRPEVMTSTATSVLIGPGRDQQWWVIKIISIPPNNGGAAWGTQLRGAAFQAGSVITLEQIFPGSPR